MEFLGSMGNRVSKKMSRDLSRSYTEEEVAVTLKQIHPSKAPGPDGMPPLFYQKYWHIVGPKVFKVVLEMLNSGQIPSALNYTFITLIPKIK